MRLNTIKSATGARKAKSRVGRGPGSGLGKTCGLGHKGQKARAGGYHKVGFEGGQMPLQRRLPKVGFRSRKARYSVEIRLSDLHKVQSDTVNLQTLKEAGLINANVKRVKVILNGELQKPLHFSGISMTAGAKAAIENAGGKILEQ